MLKLTDEQRCQWAVDGYLHLKQVFDPDEVVLYSRLIDEMRHQPGWEPHPDVPRGHYGWVERNPNADDPEAFMDRRDILSYGQPFLDLIDRPNVFDFVVDIMGPYITLSMSQAIVRASTEDFVGYTHTDGGEALRMIRVTETSKPLAMKAMYLLSDVKGPNCGNFTVFPGSHLRQIPYDTDSPPTPQTPGAAPLGGDAGDCYLFSHALWHGPSPNHSARRKTLLWYSQMFLKAYDFPTMADVADRTRQLGYSAIWSGTAG